MSDADDLLILGSFKTICDFCQDYEASNEPYTTSSPKILAVKESLLSLKKWAELEFPKYKGVSLSVDISDGSGNFPRVPWIAILPPQQKVSDGVYFVLCFGREGHGAIAGCATSVTNSTNLITVKRSENKPLRINVNGTGPKTKYNDAFANPLEINEDFDIANFKSHILESLERSFQFLCSTQSPIVLPSDNFGTFVLDNNQSVSTMSDDTKLDNLQDGSFDPKNIDDSRSRILASIAQRQGQPKFRKEVLKAYNASCAISGCTVLQILEAAHIFPYKGKPTNKVSNGILLRSDLHTLFDVGLITIEPISLRIDIDDSLMGTEYDVFSGVFLSIPKDRNQRPSEELLRWRSLFKLSHN